MKSIFENIVVAIALFLTVSCHDILDIDPSNYMLERDTYYSTETELNYALNGVYAPLASTALYGNYMIGRMGLDADETYVDYTTDEYSVADYNVESTDTKVLGYWNACYDGIKRANNLLAHVDNPAIDITGDKRADIRGQALFLRGYYYFMLVTRFQGVPLILEPLKSANVEDLQQPRASGREVYAQIIQDMERAAELVRPATAVGTGGRISKSAVWGLLARVNLYLAGHPYYEEEHYMDAMIYAGRVIGSGFHALNLSYEQIFINYAQDKYDIKESIFEVEFHSDGTGVYAAGGSVGRNNGIRNPVLEDEIGFSIGILRATNHLNSLYATDDVRRTWNIAPHYYVNSNGVAAITYWAANIPAYQRYSGKFRREHELVRPKMQAQTPQNFPILRYSDVLLMYAEAYNEYYKGADDGALEYLNMVRRRGRNVNPLVGHSSDFTNKSYDAFRSEVREERSREFCFEVLRKNDVVRWGVFHDQMIQRHGETPQTSTSSYNVRARRYFGSAEPKDQWWPIPSYEMGINRKLVQNEGW